MVLKPLSQMLWPLGMGSGLVPAMTLTATTTAPGQTVTIHRMTPAATKTLTIAWGDTTTTTVAAGDTAAQAHVYAATGSYSISITNALDIVQINLHDAKLSGLLSAQLKNAAITSCTAYSIGNATPGRFDSVDVSAWPAGDFRLYFMPAGYLGTFNSADVSAWNPVTFYLFSMPAGYLGTFNSADVSAWNPVNFNLVSMPAGYIITVAAANFAAWTKATNFRMDANALLQAQVDAILQSLYTAFATRINAGGTINVGGTNAAPSGICQAMCPPLTGKEFAYELKNDSCLINPTKKWTTVTFTA